MAGVGKSLVGRALARKLHYRFIDTDKIIEKKTGLKLQKFLEKKGQVEFLEIEERTILRLKISDRCIISPGGSVIYSKRAMRFLKKRSTVVFLSASFKSINSWIENKSTRGIIGLKRKGLRGVFQERLPLYRKYADTTIRLGKTYNVRRATERIVGRSP